MTRSLPLLLLSTFAIAQSSYESDFLEALQEVNSIASQKKLTVDNTPAIVNVLEGDQLHQKGINTLADALHLLPGIEVAKSNSDAYQIILRGYKTVSRDGAKILIDGVSVNNNLYGSTFYYLNFPVSLIERIEVMRNPNSATYGRYAFLGVINVVTKLKEHHEGQSSYLYQNDGTQMGSFLMHTQESGWDVSLDGSTEQQRGGVPSGDVYNTSTGLYRTSRETARYLEDYMLGVSLSKENFSLTARTKKYQKGNAFGYFNIVPLVTDKYFTPEHTYIEAAYADALSPDLKLDLKAGWKRYIFDAEGRYFNTGTLPHDSDLDLIIGAYEKEHEGYLNGALAWSGVEHHAMRFKGEYSRSVMIDAYNLAYVEQNGPVPLRGAANFIREDLDATRYALSFEDEIELGERLSLSVALRYDHDSDFGGHWSPYAAAIYRYSDTTNFKLLYYHGYRSPTWAELYAQSVTQQGNSGLEPETIDSVELAWLYRPSLNQLLKLNVYTSGMYNLIYQDSSFVFQNDSGCQYHRGFEMEYRYQSGNLDEFSINYSFNEGDNAISYDSAAHLLSASYLRHLGEHLVATSIFSYVGEKERIEGDTRPDVDAYWTFDQTFTYNVKGDWSLQAGVKNLFDRKVVYPSTVINGYYYPDDLVQHGRSVMFEIQKEW